MLPNPLTPQDDFIDYDDELEVAHHIASPNLLLATPTSLSSMGEDASDAAFEAQEDQIEHVREDEDMFIEDTSEGGAALHAHEAQNVTSLSNSAIPLNLLTQPWETEHDEIMADIYSYAESNSVPDLHDSLAEQITTSNLDILQTLPAALQDATVQLQHLQNAPEPAMHFFPLNSTSPFSSINVLALNSQTHDAMEGGLFMTSDPLAESSVSAGAVPQHGGIVHTVEVVTSSAPQSLHNEPLPLQDNQFWGDADIDEVEDRSNSSLGDFLYNWAITSANPPADKRLRGPSLTEIHAQRFPKELPPITAKDLRGDSCDVQRLDWNKIGPSRQEAVHRRRQTYKNYTNLPMPPNWHTHLRDSKLGNEQNYFRFRKMDFDHDIALSHFQLRNLISCASRDHVFYAGKYKILHWNPLAGTHGPKRVAMNLKNPIAQTPHGIPNGIQISTLTVAHDILVAGGFCGEYALLNLKAHKSTKHTEGIVTNHENSITNHLEVFLSRTSSKPQVAIASNDNGLRLLDVATNKLVADHSYEHAINCSAISPDSRLRVMVGDTQEVMICHAETGEILQSLKGHTDYGFACDWADDGWTVATGNQDQQIMIWDARKWTTSSGQSSPLAIVATEQAGIRKLKFSPTGSGKRVLVAAEPADIINIIDASTFLEKQNLHFFGEIGGFDFSDGGRDLIVANCDSMRGGLMEYERCNLAQRSLYESDDVMFEMYPRKGYDWCQNDEDLASLKSGWGTAESRHRNTTLLGAQMGYF